MSDSQDFAAAQAEAAKRRQVLLDAQEEAESKKAAEFLRRFVAEAERTGLKPEPLQAIGYGGKGRAKTGLMGWYLKNDHTLAVDTEGNYYVLIRELGLLGRRRTQKMVPSPPPLILSKGARDGESMDLTTKLDQMLPTWRRGGRDS